MPPEYPSISELTESYDTADRFTREVAQFRSAVAVPANNELRYAGHHRAKEQTESRRFLLQFVARVAGGLVGAIGLIWTIWYTLSSGDGAPVS